MSIYDIPIATLDGRPTSLAPYRGKVILAVNVASRCGFTPQYEGLVELQQRFADRAFTVLGFPCNQFLGQEPGAPEEIAEFCSATYGVDFPLFEKIDVNGENEHPIFTALKQATDDGGEAGDVKWNFEKILIDAEGNPVRRFRTKTKPEEDVVASAIEGLLPASRVDPSQSQTRA